MYCILSSAFGICDIVISVIISPINKLYGIAQVELFSNWITLNGRTGDAFIKLSPLPHDCLNETKITLEIIKSAFADKEEKEEERNDNLRLMQSQMRPPVIEYRISERLTIRHAKHYSRDSRGTREGGGGNRRRRKETSVRYARG